MSSFLDLANCFDSKWAIYGFQPRGIDLLQPPDDSVECAAKLNLYELRKVMEQGECHLIGHSYGGLVAYEMALQMLAMGRPPDSLAMIDTEAPDLTPIATDEESVRNRFLAALSELFEIELSDSSHLKKDGDTDEFLAHIRSALQKSGKISERSPPFMLRGPLATFGAAITQEYSPVASYSGGAKLALATDTFDATADISDWRRTNAAHWRLYVGDLSVKQIQGTHFSMLRRKNVIEFARWWSADPRPSSCHSP